MTAPTHHALLLDFHHPSGRLEHLLTSEPWAARELLYAIDRVPRSLWDHADVARVQLTFSGSLLETLSSPGFQERVYGIVKLGDLLWFLQNVQLFEMLGTAYYHPLLPTVPQADWSEHVSRWLGIGRHLLWRDELPGFWPPELGFSMELIPVLVQHGYSYVVVDSEHVEALTPMSWAELRYRPHFARYGGEQIVVVVRDRELSNAQLSGMDSAWFEREVQERTQHCEFPPLVLTACRGDEGGWFRNVRQNFWSGFYQPFLQRYRQGYHAIKPVHVQEYLTEHGAHGEVRIHSGARNVGNFSGADFSHWTGSARREQALARMAALSDEIGEVALEGHDRALLEQARWRLLRAQESSGFAGGDGQLVRVYRELDDAAEWIAKARRT